MLCASALRVPRGGEAFRAPIDAPFLSMTTFDLSALAPHPAAAASSRAGVGDAVTEARAIALSDLPVGAFATIHAVLPGEGDTDRHLVLRLIEIGFVPGERVRVIAQGHPGRQPIAVRLAATDSGRRSMSGSTFAMRRHEADFIRVVPDLPADGNEPGP